MAGIAAALPTVVVGRLGRDAEPLPRHPDLVGCRWGRGEVFLSGPSAVEGLSTKWDACRCDRPAGECLAPTNAVRCARRVSGRDHRQFQIHLEPAHQSDTQDAGHGRFGLAQWQPRGIEKKVNGINRSMRRRNLRSAWHNHRQTRVPQGNAGRNTVTNPQIPSLSTRRRPRLRPPSLRTGRAPHRPTGRYGDTPLRARWG